MDELELRETLARIEKQQRQLSDDLTKVRTSKRDIWDKITALGPIISGACIAASALIATYSYNMQQIKLQEAQTIEKFIPHLMGTDASKRMAILCLRTLVNTDIAARCAAMFPSAGTVSALKTIAKTGDSREQAIASQALDKTLSELNAQKQLDPPGTQQGQQDGSDATDTGDGFQLGDQDVKTNDADLGKLKPESSINVKESGKTKTESTPGGTGKPEQPADRKSEHPYVIAPPDPSKEKSEQNDSKERNDLKEHSVDARDRMRTDPKDRIEVKETVERDGKKI